MRVYRRIRENNTFDDIDVRNAYRAGFWVGVGATCLIGLVLFISAGLYINT